VSQITDKQYLSKADINRLLETREGRREIYLYVMRERITHGLAEIFAYLGLPIPSPDKQETACQMLWETLFRRPVWEILEERDLVEQMKKSGVIPTDADGLMKMHTEGNC